MRSTTYPTKVERFAFAATRITVRDGVRRAIRIRREGEGQLRGEREKEREMVEPGAFPLGISGLAKRIRMQCQGHLTKNGRLSCSRRRVNQSLAHW
jgi:hypothetical protein